MLCFVHALTPAVRPYASLAAACGAVSCFAKGRVLPGSVDPTFAEAHELEHGDASIGKQLARLGAAGCPEQLHLHYPVLDRHLSHKGGLEIKGQGAIIVCMLQVAGVLLTTHCHLQNMPQCSCKTLLCCHFQLRTSLLTGVRFFSKLC